MIFAALAGCTQDKYWADGTYYPIWFNGKYYGPPPYNGMPPPRVLAQIKLSGSAPIVHQAEAPTPAKLLAAQAQLIELYDRLASEMSQDQQRQLSADQTDWLNDEAVTCSHDGKSDRQCEINAAVARADVISARLAAFKPAPPEIAVTPPPVKKPEIAVASAAQTETAMAPPPAMPAKIAAVTPPATQATPPPDPIAAPPFAVQAKSPAAAPASLPRQTTPPGILPEAAAAPLPTPPPASTAAPPARTKPDLASQSPTVTLPTASAAALPVPQTAAAQSGFAAPPPPDTKLAAAAPALPPESAAAPRPAPQPASPTAPAAQPEATYTVAATAMPWVWKKSATNAQFSFGMQDGTAPTSIPLAALDAKPGQSLSIRYISGKITLGFGTPLTDAAGYMVQHDDHGIGITGQPLPSLYLKSHHANLASLIGVFTDKSGSIIGAPFAVGDGPVRALVPPQASQLQLGINDDIYGEENLSTANTGAFVIAVSKIPDS